jgi:hypothetical protein
VRNILFLFHPPQALNGPEEKKVSFQQVLERSLNFDQTNSCWCEGCKKYRPTKMTRRFESIPFILAMNCGLTTDEDVEFFKNQLELARGGQEVKDPTQATKVPAAGAGTTTSPKVTPCRFGAECKRPFCRYSHENKTSATGELRFFYIFFSVNFLQSFNYGCEEAIPSKL